MARRPQNTGLLLNCPLSADLMISLQALYKFAKASVRRWTRSSNNAGAGFLLQFSL
jgi:hypothetical protein